MVRISDFTILNIIVLLCFSLMSCNTTSIKKIEFNSELWKRSGGESLLTDTRKRMVDDLLSRELLLNKNESAIEDMLGFSSGLNKTDTINIKYYQVKEVYRLDIDPEKLIFLEVVFNEKGASKKVTMIETK